MEWIENFELFLFDFDGLLVDTEALHFEAYCQLALHYKIPPPAASLSEYLGIAHTDGLALKKYFLSFLGKDVSWEKIYAEKKAIYTHLLGCGKCALMPGVEALLYALQERSIDRCVVTHSPKEAVDMIRRHLPLLDLIPVWLTREDYIHPKPSPEGYLKARNLFSKGREKAIGFEDSLRGFQALEQAIDHPILVCSLDHPQLQTIDLQKIRHYPQLPLVL